MMPWKAAVNAYDIFIIFVFVKGVGFVMKALRGLIIVKNETHMFGEWAAMASGYDALSY